MTAAVLEPPGPRGVPAPGRAPEPAADAASRASRLRDPLHARDRARDPERTAPRGPYSRFGKRALNLFLLVVVGPPALLLAVPIVAMNWVLFRDLRSVLYTQPRIGHKGRVFHIKKFRTMREEKESAFDSWCEGRDRLRVTRFGRWLRNTHLDELPQLLNVLKGEMDFVGPRPEMIEIHRWACERVPGFEERNAVLPGITGYAQVTQGYTGMDVRAYRDKLAADLRYVRAVSLGLDLEILLRTGLWMLRGRGWTSWSPEPARIADSH